MVLRTGDFSHQRLGVFDPAGSQVKRERSQTDAALWRSLKELCYDTLISRNHTFQSEPLRPERSSIRSERRAQLFIRRQPPNGQFQ